MLKLLERHIFLLSLAQTEDDEFWQMPVSHTSLDHILVVHFLFLALLQKMVDPCVLLDDVLHITEGGLVAIPFVFQQRHFIVAYRLIQIGPI